MNDRSNDITRERIKRILKIFVRLFSIPLVMGFGILAGIGIVELIDFFVTEYPKYGDLRSTFYTGSMAFGAAIILSIIKDLTQNMPNFYSYVFAKDNQQSREAFLKAFGAIFLASFALMLSFRSGTEIVPSKKPVALALNLEFYRSIIPSPMDTKKSLLTVYILYSESAGLKSMGNDYKHPSLCHRDNNDLSVCPDKLYDDLLERLMGALISCSESANPTEVEVRGFASAGLATDFDPGKLKDKYKIELEENYKRVGNEDDDKIKYGKAFNLYIAERRAENLVTKLEEIVENNPNIRISLPKWKNYQEMECELNIDDTDECVYDPSRGFLTRRAEIRVLEAPGCEKDI